MKGVVVTTDNSVEIREFDRPLYRSVGQIVGGYIEIVHPVGLAEPLVMIVNEEGLLHGLPKNILGSLLYGTHIHGQPIVGNFVVMQTGYDNGEPDIVGLDDVTATELAQTFEQFFAMKF